MYMLSPRKQASREHARTPARLARLFVVIYSCASAPSQEPTNARVELCSVSAVQTLHCMMCRAKCVIVNSVCTHAFGETHTHICRNSSARPLLNLTVTLTTESTEPDRGSPGVMLVFLSCASQNIERTTHSSCHSGQHLKTCCVFTQEHTMYDDMVVAAVCSQW